MNRLILCTFSLIMFIAFGKAHAQTYNVLKTAYFPDTAIGQAIPFTTAMRSGGTLVFSVSAMDGGGRTGENDVAFLRISFFDGSGGMVNQQRTANFTLNKSTFTTLSLSTTDCGGSCANVAYAVIEMIGTDASFWAGNYGVNWKLPSVTYTGILGNLVYNPEFGVAPGTLAVQGWVQASQWGDPGFGVCTGAGGGSNSCITDTTIVANSTNGGYSASGGTVPPPSAPAYPSYVTIGGGTAGTMTFNETSSLSATQQSKVNTWLNSTVSNGNLIYIDQVNGSNNTVTMDQDGNRNAITLRLQGTNNNITAKQGVQGIGQNEMKLNIEGNNNGINLNQARDTQGNAVGTNGHHLSVDIAGWGTNLIVQQTNSGGVGSHYNETTIIGNGNSVTAKQLDNGNKVMFIKVEGAINSVDATQKGTAQHKADITLTGDRNNATLLQEGNIANNATLNLTNAGGPASVNVQQNGGQNVGVTTTCSTAGGCAPIIVRQGY